MSSNEPQIEIGSSFLAWIRRVRRSAVHSRWFLEVLAGLGVSNGLVCPNAIRFWLFL
jgi:hypothetical protein